ncbi:hypothetical protein HRbin32_00295 [bacterium HR32]|nr:hypothetical protein HRbin32_00295 [bacterium HR32]
MYVANSLTTVTDPALTKRAPRARMRSAYWDSFTMWRTWV